MTGIIVLLNLSPSAPSVNVSDLTTIHLRLYSQYISCQVPHQPLRSPLPPDDADVTVPDDADDEPAHPGGVRLRRPGYYTIPALAELAPAADGSLTVEGLTIGRHGYGSVFFPGETELAGLDLDAVVVFRRREICIYPDDALKPPLGQGLNKPAQVSLGGAQGWWRSGGVQGHRPHPE